jgi:hypothetical protein
MSSAAFTDIKITGLNVDLTQPSDKASGLRHMYLSLSAEPTREWIEIFQAERQFPRHSMWRDAWVETDHIVVDCVPDEIEKYHLSDLKQDAAKTNQKYRDYLAKVELHNQQQQKAHREEHDRLNGIRDRLNFD